MSNLNSCGYLQAFVFNPDSYAWLVALILFVCGSVIVLSGTTVTEFEKNCAKNTLLTLAGGAFVSVALTLVSTGFAYWVTSDEISKEDYQIYSAELAWLEKADPKNPQTTAVKNFVQCSMSDNKISTFEYGYFMDLKKKIEASKELGEVKQKIFQNTK